MPRYPIRARRRPPRKGMTRQMMVIGGAYEAPVSGLVIYPIRGGGFYPSLCIAIFEVLNLCLLV